MHVCDICGADCRCDGTDIRLNDFDECTHCVLEEEPDEDLDDPFDDEPDEDDDLDADDDDDDESDDEDGELVHAGESGHE